MATTYHLQLEKSQVDQFVEGRTQGFRVQLTITEAENVAPEVFVFQRGPSSTVFCNIASPSDLEEYPTEAEAIASDVFFRKDTVTLDFRNMGLLRSAVTAIAQDLSGLLQALEANERLADEEIIDIVV